MPHRILIGEKEYAKGAAVFPHVPDFEFLPAPAPEDELAALLRREPQVRAVIVGMTPYRGSLYRALQANAAGAPSLIARFGVGHENIDKPLARAHGCLVANTPGVLDVSVAEHSLWLIGAVARRLTEADATFRAGDWHAAPGVELAGKHLGLIGFGRIAQRVAAIAHFGFGMRVTAAGTSSPAEWSARHGQSLEEVLAQCGLETYTDNATAILAEADYVSLHLPGSAENRHFLNAARLAQMKPTAVLINTARGIVVDESALFDALSAKRLAGAGLDVFQQEPYQPVAADKDLRTLPNAILTPHIGSNTAEANRRMAEKCVANLRAFFANDQASLALV